MVGSVVCRRNLARTRFWDSPETDADSEQGRSVKPLEAYRTEELDRTKLNFTVSIPAVMLHVITLCSGFRIRGPASGPASTTDQKCQACQR
jgi:hypothetical protein